MKTNFYISCCLLATTSIMFSCSKSNSPSIDTPIEELKPISISNLNLKSSYYVSDNYTMIIAATGLVSGDKIILKNTKTTSLTYELAIQNIQTDKAEIVIPKGFEGGNYSIIISRGSQTRTLASANFIKIFNANITEKEGTTIKGSVFANGKGIPNVVVSDGVELTQTNADGSYQLSSAKKNGYVFISIPSNYEVKTTANIPQFFQYTTESNKNVEIKDFELTSVQNDNHTMIVMTDFHLANRTDDLLQFETGFIKDVNASITQLKSEGKKVYGLTLGDLSWDLYWYSNKFALPEFIPQMAKVNIPTFHAIGNHDNDPYYANDWDSESAYKKVIGPTYYSFNIGKIHYIVLDNIEYLNTGGASGTVGNRNYNAKISSDQLEWLKKDLAFITDKSTPIVVGMHVQLNNAPSINQTANLRLSNGQDLLTALSNFDNVHLLSGHTHVNYTVENTTKLMEHNIGAVCGTWWWTGKSNYTGNHISKDGSPGGYAVWDMSSKNMQWYYKGIGKEKTYQFRAYDLNQVHITAAKFAPKSTDAKLKEYISNYGTVNNKNEILVNVWGYDPKWKVEIIENGSPLTVSRVAAYDPLQIVSYAAMRLNDNATPTEDFVANNSTHFFKATASSATSSVTIKVTDRFNNVYQETMTRPKAFTINMQ